MNGPKSTLIDMIRLTIVSDVDGSARIKNGELAGVIYAVRIVQILIHAIIACFVPIFHKSFGVSRESRR